MAKYKVGRSYFEYVYVEADNEYEAIEEACYDNDTNMSFDVDPEDVELVEED